MFEEAYITLARARPLLMCVSINHILIFFLNVEESGKPKLAIIRAALIIAACATAIPLGSRAHGLLLPDWDVSWFSPCSRHHHCPVRPTNHFLIVLPVLILLQICIFKKRSRRGVRFFAHFETPRRFRDGVGTVSSQIVLSVEGKGSHYNEHNWLFNFQRHTTNFWEVN